MEKVTKKQFASNSIWKILESFLSKGVTLLVSIVLARLLDASVFGLIALTAVFTSLADILLENGFTAALISKKNCDDVDYSNSIVVSFIIALALYIIVFFSAPSLAAYYEEPDLVGIMRILGLIYFVQIFAAPRTAKVTRQMKFRLLFVCNLVSSIISGVIGIVFAYLNFGAWAIVIQRLSQQVLLTIILFIFIRWKIKFKVDFRRMLDLTKNTFGIVIGLLINYAGTAITSLVIAKIYSVTDLGYYDKGPSLPMQLSLYTFGAITSVLLPTLVSYQGDIEKIKSIVRRLNRLIAFVLAPMMVGMLLVSKELIIVLYGDKWLPMLKIMQFSCLYYLATPFMLMNTQIFLSLGHTSIRIKTELIRLSMMLAVVFGLSMGLHCSIDELALANAIVAVISVFISFYDVKRYIKYTFTDFLADIALPLIICQAMFALLMGYDTWLSQYSFTAYSLISLLSKVIIGIGIYAVGSFIFNLDSFYEIIDIIKSFSKRKQNA